MLINPELNEGMYWLPHDLGAWGFYLSLAAILLMYPVGLLINLTTPVVQNWLARRTKSSLKNKISELERRLSELEKLPAIDEVQDNVLWGIKSVRIGILAATNTIIIVIYLAAAVLSNRGSAPFASLSGFVLLALTVNSLLMLGMRYRRDFRYVRSPRYRKNLMKTIEELKKIQDS